MESGGGAAERSSSSGGWGEPRPTPCLTHTPPRQAYIPTGARRGRFDASHDSWELEANLSVGLAAAFRKKRRQQASAPEPRRCAEPPREPVQEAGLDGEGPAAAQREKFAKLVMCDYTPRKPSELPMAQWASYKQLLRLSEPHAEVRQFGPGNLKQQIIAWYSSHPAFAGLEVNKWCKKLTDNGTRGRCSQVYKFSFEYTPGGRVPDPAGAVCQALHAQTPQPDAHDSVGELNATGRDCETVCPGSGVE